MQITTIYDDARVLDRIVSKKNEYCTEDEATDEFGSLTFGNGREDRVARAMPVRHASVTLVPHPPEAAQIAVARSSNLMRWSAG